MDLATIIGVVFTFGALFAMLFMEGSSPSAIFLIPPMLLIFGATIGAGIAGSTLGDVVHSFKQLPRAFTGRVTKPGASIDQLVELAEKARRDGMLSLESAASEIKDPFLKQALQNLADGTDGEELETLLDTGIQSKAHSDQIAAKFFHALGGYAPTVGIIGTVVSLTHVMENLSDPSHLGPLIASAFVATLWGLLSANFLWLPIGARLHKISSIEVERMTMQMEGILAIQAGAQPLLLRERLSAMVPDHQRSKASDKKGKGTTSAKPVADVDAGSADLGRAA